MFAKFRRLRENHGAPPFQGAPTPFRSAKGRMLKSAGFLAVLFLFALGPLGAQARPVWVLSGSVLPGPTEEKGHYEVGLFSLLGGDGLPVGYPLVQEILPAGRATFRLRVPARISRAYLFAELVEEGAGASGSR